MDAPGGASSSSSIGPNVPHFPMPTRRPPQLPKENAHQPKAHGPKAFPYKLWGDEDVLVAAPIIELSDEESCEVMDESEPMDC
jgi:hypothetical protein